MNVILLSLQSHPNAKLLYPNPDNNLTVDCVGLDTKAVWRISSKF